MRRFLLNRKVDISGVSGIGVVAEGVEWHDGQVNLSWFGRYHSIETWPSVDACMAIHGHGGHTEIEWIDGSTPSEEDVLKNKAIELADKAALNGDWEVVEALLEVARKI